MELIMNEQYFCSSKSWAKISEAQRIVKSREVYIPNIASDL